MAAATSRLVTWALALLGFALVCHSWGPALALLFMAGRVMLAGLFRQGDQAYPLPDVVTRAWDRVRYWTLAARYAYRRRLIVMDTADRWMPARYAS